MANETVLANLINPQVMADMISARLENSIRFAPLATIGRRLVATPGNTITMPKYKYIGDAVDTAENAEVDYSKLETTSTEVTVKKVTKGVKITDEAKLSAYGDPYGEAVNQLLQAISQKIDNDCIDSLSDVVLYASTESTTKVTAADIIRAKAKFGEKVAEPAVLLVSTDRYIDIILDSAFDKTALGAQMIMAGVVGQIGGCQVVVSNKLSANEMYIIKAGAFGIELKRSILVETERDIDYKLDKVNADEHYVAYLKDDTKAIKLSLSTGSAFTFTSNKIGTVMADANQTVSQANQDAVTVSYNGTNIEVKGNLASLNSFASTVPAQGTGKWVGLLIGTGMTTLVGVTYTKPDVAPYSFVTADETEAASVGGGAGEFTYWFKAEDVVKKSSTFTLSKSGVDTITVNVKFKNIA